jgi:hypothetical protein
MTLPEVCRRRAFETRPLVSFEVLLGVVVVADRVAHPIRIRRCGSHGNVQNAPRFTNQTYSPRRISGFVSQFSGAKEVVARDC